MSMQDDPKQKPQAGPSAPVPAPPQPVDIQAQQPNSPQKPGQTPGVTATDPLLLQPSQLRKINADQAGEGASKNPSGMRDLVAFVGILSIAALLAFILISFVFRSYVVDGPSMESTLQNEDKLLIWKLPRTIAGLTGHQYVPHRGDVVIFTEDNLSACGQVGSRQIIKRVIALPGERITIKNDQYVVYNSAHPAGFKPDASLPYNKDGHVPGPTGVVNLTLAKDQVFVSGDNRPNSCDSRAFGPIQTKQIIGKLVLRLLPANQMKVF